MITHEGKLVVKDQKFAIVMSRFNDFINNKLLEGAVDCLVRHNADENNIEVFRVPGAFEIPIAAQKAAETKKFDAIICIGTVIRGATPHFDYISSEVSKGIANVGLKTGIPIVFGILTTDTLDQAIERAGTKSGNKGWDAALSAIEMVNLFGEM